MVQAYSSLLDEAHKSTYIHVSVHIHIVNLLFVSVSKCLPQLGPSLSSVTMYSWPCDSSQSRMPKEFSAQPTKFGFIEAYSFAL